MSSKQKAIAAYDEAMDAFGIPRVPLEVYDSCSWRRVGLAGEYKTLLWPCVAQDGQPDISNPALLRALVAAFNAMLSIRDASSTSSEQS